MLGEAGVIQYSANVMLAKSGIYHSDERFGAKLRVTENRCAVFDFSTYVYFALLLQH